MKEEKRREPLSPEYLEKTHADAGRTWNTKRHVNNILYNNITMLRDMKTDLNWTGIWLNFVFVGFFSLPLWGCGIVCLHKFHRHLDLFGMTASRKGCLLINLAPSDKTLNKWYLTSGDLKPLHGCRHVPVGKEERKCAAFAKWEMFRVSVGLADFSLTFCVG